MRSKQIIAFVTVFILLMKANMSFAQVFIPEMFFGGGVSCSSFISNDIDSKSRLGFNLNFGYRVETLDDFDYMISFDFSQMGANTKGRVLNANTLDSNYQDSKFYFSQLSLLYLLNYYVDDPKLSFQAGLKVAFLWPFKPGVEIENLYYGSYDNVDDNISAEDMYDELFADYALVVGVGTGTESCELHLNYSYYLTNLCRNIDNSQYSFSARNSLIELKLLFFIGTFF